MADYHFRLADGIDFSRRVQQFSLSLDKNFKRNLDYYVDRFARITEFLKTRWNVLSPITFPGTASQANLSRDFEYLAADRLQSRIFDFGNGRESKSQYTGLTQFGPLKPLSEVPNIIFVFQEKDRQAARDLAIALRGSRERRRFNFPGFEGLFKTPLKIDSNPVVLPDFSMKSMNVALERIRQEPGLKLPVLIVPDDDADPYLFYAYEFRKYSLLAKLIVCVGYGFGDDHINKILSQTLRDEENRRLLVISDILDSIPYAKDMKRSEIVSLMKAKDSQVIVETGKAKGFLETTDLATRLLSLIPPSPDSPF